MSAQPVAARHAVPRAFGAVAPDRRALLALGIAPFLGSLAFAVAPPFFPAVGRDLGVGAPLLGQVVTAMLLFGAALALVVGPLADRHGPRRPLILGAVAAAGCLLGFGLAPTFPAFVGAGLLGGAAWATLPALSLAVASTAFAGTARPRAIGWATAALALVDILGLPLLAVAGDAAGWRAAFVAAGLVALGATWLMAGCLPPNAPRSVWAPRPGALLAAHRPLFRHHPTCRLLAATTLRAVCMLGLLTYAGTLLATESGFGTQAIATAYALNGGGYVLGGLTAGRLLGRVPARGLVAAANAALALLTGLVFAAPFDAVVIVALLALAGIAGAAGWAGTATLLTEQTPAGAGTTMALNGSLFNVGAAGGSALGGGLLAVGGYVALGLALPLFALAAALLAHPPLRPSQAQG